MSFAPHKRSEMNWAPSLAVRFREGAGTAQELCSVVAVRLAHALLVDGVPSCHAPPPRRTSASRGP